MTPSPETPYAHTLLGVLRRRAWLVVLCAFGVPLVAILLSQRQEPLYSASSEVLLSNEDLAAGVTGIDATRVYFDPIREAATQARVARALVVAERTVRALGLRDRSGDDLLGSSSVSSSETTDVLEFTVEDANRDLAAALANEYGRQYIAHRGQLDTAAVQRALKEVRRRIAVLEDNGRAGSDLHGTLLESEQQLSTLEALKTAGATLLRPAEVAVQVRPRTVRNGVIGLGLGLVFGLGLAFLLEALDTRVRSADDVARGLGLSLLARVPGPPARSRDPGGVAMLTDPTGIQAEAFRILRTNVEFVNLDRHARTIMVTSALQEEGKSTTVANLAAALARAGRHVVLVDLDLRRPLLDRLFGLEGPGLTDVALGHAKLDDALVAVSLGDGPDRSGFAAATSNGGGAGTLEVLASGPTPPNTGEFVGTRAVADILTRLRAQADLVLIDAPPLLGVGDAITLSARVDALLVVARLNLVRRPILGELRRVLEASPADPLGFVLTGAKREDGYGYASRYGSDRRARGHRQPVA